MSDITLLPNRLDRDAINDAEIGDVIEIVGSNQRIVCEVTKTDE